ncbi:MAG TPA: GNAT family N-acetyltransferase [Thermomicrobiaceae bacterium]|nr:GNAT family N-acetyltransferase [Thermomicrobiaceae bacterium]
MTALRGDPVDRTRSRDVRTWLVQTLDDMPHVYDVRYDVFVREQGIASNVHDDPDDRYSLHVLASVRDEIVGTGRITFFGDEAQVVWVAVLKPYRGFGVGRAVMEHLLDLAREHGSRVVTLNAQTHALSFYNALGFRAIGRRFFMSNIEHQYMALDLRET